MFIKVAKGNIGSNTYPIIKLSMGKLYKCYSLCFYILGIYLFQSMFGYLFFNQYFSLILTVTIHISRIDQRISVLNNRQTDKTKLLKLLTDKNS